MGMTPHMVTMMILEKPQALAQLAAAKGAEPPETPEEAVEKLKDPSLSPEDRQRLQSIAANVKPEEGTFNTTVPQALGAAGKSLMQFAPETGNQPLRSGQDEQNSMRGREGKNALTSALDPSAASPAPKRAGGFDPDAPGSPGIPAASAPSGNIGAAAGAPPQQPQQPGLAPLTQSMMQPQAPVTINVASPQQGPNPMAPNPSMIGAMPPTAAAAPAAAPGADWNRVSAALSGMAGVGAPSTPGGGTPELRPPSPVAPYNPGALQPQTLAIMQQLMAQQQGASIPGLQSLLNGAR